MPQAARDHTSTQSTPSRGLAVVPGNRSGATRHAALDKSMELSLDGSLSGPGQSPIPWADLDPQLAALAEGVARRMLRANDQDRPEARLLRRLCARHGAGVLLTGGRLILDENPGTDPADASGEISGADIPSLEQVIRPLAELPGRSGLVRGVAEAVAHPMSNAGRVADGVAKDRGLAALALRLVNAPFFGLGAPITSLERALTFVGLGEIQALALAVAAQRVLLKDGARRELAWRRGLTCAVAARILARRLHVPAEGMFAAGLLHGLGDAVLERVAPKPARSARHLAAGRDLSLAQAQLQVLGYDAAQVGGEVLRSWALAPEAADLVAHQHDPSRSGRPAQAMVLHLAVALAAALDLSESGLIPAPVLDPAAWEVADLGVRSLTAVVDQTLRDRVALMRVLDR